MMKYSESTIYINHENLKYNIEWIRSKTQSSFICPMVKANSYGGGAIQIAGALRQLGVQYFGVARLSEAVELRQNGIDCNILLFNHFTSDELPEIFNQRITFVVSSLPQLELLGRYLRDHKESAKVHLEFDTGMSRLGFQKEELTQLKAKLQEYPELKLEGVFTHFLDASNWPQKEGSSSIQYRIFDEIAQSFPDALAHIASSKTLENEPGKIKFGLRPGLWLLGIQAESVGLKPVLRLASPVISLRTIAQGQTVSYSGLWTAPRESVIATLPVGYGDGYSRRLTGQSHVILQGHRVPTVGAICMDYMMVDVTEIKDQIQLWDEATVIGQDPCGLDISVESLAEKCGVFVYEFVVRLSRRLKRQLVGGTTEVLKSTDSIIKN